MFRNMKIGARLGLGFGLVLLLLGAVATMGLSRMSNLNDGMSHVVEGRYPKTQ